MAYIGRQQSSSSFIKLDSIKPLFDGNRVTFPLTLGGDGFFPGNPYSLLVSLGGVIQEPISSFNIVENRITFAAAPLTNTQFYAIVLATTDIPPLQSLTIGTRTTAQMIDLHGRAMAVRTRGSVNIPIAFNLT
tara:strand:- start:226 stop:624 length:399 start_codon:yes stop_codon:yes gene_type:complete